MKKADIKIAYRESYINMHGETLTIITDKDNVLWFNHNDCLPEDEYIKLDISIFKEFVFNERESKFILIFLS